MTQAAAEAQAIDQAPPSPRSQAIARALGERFDHLPIELIQPSATNPRQHFDDAYLADLANSVRDKGVLQPILVRPLPPSTKGNGKVRADRYEIVAGECRYRASQLAGLTHLPAVIRAYTDEQVLETQLIENLHRQDLTALEQARGYRALIDTNPTKHSAESIATRIGMSPAWVWDRMKLLDLVPEAQRLLEAERMTVGHAILIARLKPGDQKRVIDPGAGRNGYHNGRDGLWQYDGGRLELDETEERRLEKTDKYHQLKPVSVRELETWIRDHIRFDVAHAAQAQPLVFEETKATVEQAAAQPGRGKKVIAITHEYRVADDARDDAERTYGSQSWERADGQKKSKTCEHSVLGVVVAGAGQGETLQVCVARDKCRVHFGKVIAQKEVNQKLRESGKGKQADRREAKQRETWEEANRKREAEAARWKALSGPAVKACAAKLKDKPITSAILCELLADVLGYRGTLKQVEALLGAAVTAKTFVRALAIAEILERDGTREYFKPIAKRYGVDLTKLEKDLQPAGVKAKKTA